MRILILLFCLSTLIESNAQNGIYSVGGARGVAMAGASNTFKDINSIFANQAGLSHLKNAEAVLYSDQQFLVNEIRNIAAAFAIPSNFGTFGFNLHYHGFKDFNEQKVGLNYARMLSENVSIGAQINYFGIRIPEYGNRGLLSAEIGIRSQVFEEFTIAAHISNPIRIEIVEGENLPTIFTFGLAYQPSRKLLLTAEAEKDIEFPVAVKFGMEYQIANPFLIRLGVSTTPTLFNFGMGIILKKLLIVDIAASYHQTLGFSPAIALRFSF